MTMKRREFIQSALSYSGIAIATTATLGLWGCGRAEQEALEATSDLHGIGDEDFVIMYDTYAMALYMDGGLGPKTGVIKVDYIIKNQEMTLDFWHGHGGRQHKFTLKPEHFATLKQNKKVVIETTSVDSHTHKLFIDPTDSRWRVPGAQPVRVPKK